MADQSNPEARTSAVEGEREERLLSPPRPDLSPRPVPDPGPGGTGHGSSGGPTPAPSPAHAADRLGPGQQLNVNDRLTPPNARTYLILQPDGNLVLYRSYNEAALWSSHTYGKAITRAVMQNDGNFVCYDNSGRAYWATGTHDHPGSRIILQDDGNLVLYDPNTVPLWASNTAHNWDPMTFYTDRQHVGTGEWMESWASLASNGLISGHTHIWCTKDLAGFHGSVFPVLLDGTGNIVWPPNPQDVKHQYGVDGRWVGVSDRTSYWSDQVDAGALGQAKSLALIQFLDPKNMLLTDLHIIGKALPVVAAMIAAL